MVDYIVAVCGDGNFQSEQPTPVPLTRAREKIAGGEANGRGLILRHCGRVFLAWNGLVGATFGSARENSDCGCKTTHLITPFEAARDVCIPLIIYTIKTSLAFAQYYENK
jgi:hypothetical protein